MSLKIVVLAKQVPDTRNVGKDAMKADGTINRATQCRERCHESRRNHQPCGPSRYLQP